MDQQQCSSSVPQDYQGYLPKPKAVVTDELMGNMANVSGHSLQGHTSAGSCCMSPYLKLVIHHPDSECMHSTYMIDITIPGHPEAAPAMGQFGSWSGIDMDLDK